MGDRRAGVYTEHTPTPVESAPTEDHDAGTARNMRPDLRVPHRRARGRCRPVAASPVRSTAVAAQPPLSCQTPGRDRDSQPPKTTRQQPRYPLPLTVPTTCPNCCHRSDGHHHCRPTIPTKRGAPFLPLPAHRMGSHARGAATHWPCRSQGARPEPQPGGQPSISTGHHGGTGCSGRRAVRPPVQGSHRAQRRPPGHDAG